MKKDSKGNLLNTVGFSDDRLLHLLQLLFDQEQHKLDAFVTTIAEYDVGKEQVVPNLYLLPLASIFLAWQYRNKRMDRKQVKVVYPILESQHLQILSLREHPASGLPYLISPEESALPDGSYWSLLKGDSILEPSFIGLMAAALEALIFLGRQIRKSNSALVEANELLVYSTNEYLWDEEYGIYFPYAISQQQQIINNSIGGALPLIADLPSQEQAEAIHRALILNFVNEQHYYFPTECLEDGTEQRSTNTLLNWLLYQGLQRFEFESTADTLKIHNLQILAGATAGYQFESRIPSKRKPNKAKKRGMALLLQQAFQQLADNHFSNQG